MLHNITYEKWIFLILAAFCGIIYTVTFKYSFVNLDDIIYLHSIKDHHNGIFDTIFWAFTSVVNANWHPLTVLSLAVDYHVYGDHAEGFHVSNVILHTLNSFLVFLVFNKLSKNVFVSLLVACLFVIHPLNVESVAWVSERKGLLSAFFMFLSLNYYLESKSKNKKYFSLFSLLFFIAALLSKAVVIVFPLLLILIDLYILLRERKKITSNAVISILLDKWIYFVIAFIMGVITILVQYRSGVILVEGTSGLYDRVLNAINSYVVYLFQIIYPDKLFVEYPTKVLSGWKIFSDVFVLIAVSYIAFYNRYKHPYLIFGWLWFVVGLLPVIGIIQTGSHSHADRYMYIPLLGLFFSFSMFLDSLSDKSRLLKALFVGLIVFMLTWLSIGQVIVWRNTETLYDNILRYNPTNYIANINLATTYIIKGNIRAAMKHYEVAKNNTPNYRVIYTAMINAFLQKQMYDNAVKILNDELNLKNGRDQVYQEIAKVRIKQGKYELAINALKNSMEIKPSNLSLYMLGYAFFQKGDLSVSEYFFNLHRHSGDENSGTLIFLAKIYATQKEEEKLRDVVDELRRKYPDAYIRHIRQ